MTKTQIKTLEQRIEDHKQALRYETNEAARKCIEQQLVCWTVELMLA